MNTVTIAVPNVSLILQGFDSVRLYRDPVGTTPPYGTPITTITLLAGVISYSYTDLLGTATDTYGATYYQSQTLVESPLGVIRGAGVVNGQPSSTVDLHFSYDPTTSIGQVRLATGDTQSGAVLLQDEEITQYLNQYGNVYYAASYAAEAIAGIFSRQVDRSLSGLSLSNSQRVTQYMALAKALRRQGALQAAMPYAGGISVVDKQNQEQNTDRVPPMFTRRLFEVVGTTLPEQSQTQSPLTDGD